MKKFLDKIYNLSVFTKLDNVIENMSPVMLMSPPGGGRGGGFGGRPPMGRPPMRGRPPMGGFGGLGGFGRRVVIPPVIPIPIPVGRTNTGNQTGYNEVKTPEELEKLKQQNKKAPTPPPAPQKNQYMLIRIFACVAVALLSDAIMPFSVLLPFLKIGTTAMATTLAAYIGSWIINGLKIPTKMKTLRYIFIGTAALNFIDLIASSNIVTSVIVGAIGIAGYYLIVLAEKLLTKIKKNQQEKPFKVKKEKAPKAEKVPKPKPEKEEKAKKSNTGNSELDVIIDQGNEYIAKLKKADIAIEHNGISLSIRRMERACQSIFEYIEDKPEKISQIKKFLNYYLPTTLKLLDSYEKMDRQSYKGENINSTMFEIEGMMNTIAQAFEKQLDSLFSQEAMDIQADISVFDSILKQEGLTDDDKN
ncbi:MAG: 5-bromo-4-chloroindolyl phosphate hydrolysis family protein [Clostridia bacterium]